MLAKAAARAIAQVLDGIPRLRLVRGRQCRLDEVGTAAGAAAASAQQITAAHGVEDALAAEVGLAAAEAAGVGLPGDDVVAQRGKAVGGLVPIGRGGRSGMVRAMATTPGGGDATEPDFTRSKGIAIAGPVCRSGPRSFDYE